MQCHLFQKTFDFINSDKKIHDQLTHHVAVRMDVPILIADDKITCHLRRLSKQIFQVMVLETSHSCLAN